VIRVRTSRRFHPPTWLLQVIGKGDRERFVPVSDECIAALHAHWRDRGLDFHAPDAGAPLIAPLVIPGTKKAREKFGLDEGKEDVTGVPLQEGYSVRGARGLTSWAIVQMLEHLTDLNDSGRRQLARTSPHALRHTLRSARSRWRPTSRSTSCSESWGTLQCRPPRPT